MDFHTRDWVAENLGAAVQLLDRSLSALGPETAPEIHDAKALAAEARRLLVGAWAIVRAADTSDAKVRP